LEAEERLEAGRRITSMPDLKGQQTLLSVLEDPKEDDRLRTIALFKVALIGNQKLVLALADIVSKRGDGGELLKIAAIDRLRVIAGFTMIGHELLPQILQAWRVAIRSPYPNVRMRALEALAIRRDPSGLRFLVRVLSGQRPTGPTKAQAIRLLSMDNSKRYFASFRVQLAEGDRETRVAATRALSRDEASRATP
jgi:hypothetical protein